MVTDVEVTGSEHSADRSALIDALGPPPVDPSNEVRIIDSLNARRGPNRVMMLNHFERRVLLGRGQHGEVFEGLDTDKNTLVAIKAMKRKNDKRDKMKLLTKSAMTATPHTALTDRLGSTENKIRKEIAIMKKCRHAHVVRLLEVIDDKLTQKIYLIMEHLGGGEIKWRTNGHEPILSVDQSRRIFRDAILGLEYLHYQGIIHRDIKPANLLWTEDRQMVKISDFGVSHFSLALRKSAAGAGQAALDDPPDPRLDDEKELSKRAGTPPFFAPELLAEYKEMTMTPTLTSSNSLFGTFRSGQEDRSSSTVHLPSAQPPKWKRCTITKAIDVWALGITLYCLLFGRIPYDFGNEFKMYVDIANSDWGVEECMGYDRLPTGGRHPRPQDHFEGAIVMRILDGMLQKDAQKRTTLEAVKSHPWVTRDITDPVEWLRETSPSKHDVVTVTDVETQSALSSLKFRNTWHKRIGHRLSSMFHRPSRPSRSADHSGDEGKVGTNSAPHIDSRVMRNGKQKSKTREAGKTDFQEKGKAIDLREKGKKKGGRPKTARNESAPNVTTNTRSKSTDRWPAIARENISALALRGSGRKSRRGSETLLSPADSSTVSHSPEAESPSSSRAGDHSGWGHSRLSLSQMKNWRPSFKSYSHGSTPSSATGQSPTVGPSSGVKDRKSDEIRNFFAGPESPLIFARRASSWGEASDYDYVEEALSMSEDEVFVDRDLDPSPNQNPTEATERAKARWVTGGVSDDPPFGPTPISLAIAAQAASAVPLPLRQPQPERLLLSNPTPTEPDPAMQDSHFVRQSQARSQATSPSPLAQMTYGSDIDGPFDDSDDESLYGDVIEDGHYHGGAYPDNVSVGSGQIYEEDEESDEDSIPIEVKRRRPSVAITSASPTPPLEGEPS